MEEKNFLITIAAFLLFFVILSVKSDDGVPNRAIYYGNNEVYVGEQFNFTCIIAISEPISWSKDKKPIKNHNLRHGKDEHAYILLPDKFVEGDKNKIESTVIVHHALKVHEGEYQCNDLHSNSHKLIVKSNNDFLITTNNLDIDTSFNPSTEASVKNIKIWLNQTINKSFESPKFNKDDILVPTYDDPVRKIKSYEVKKQLVLSCNVTRGDSELKWEKNGTDVTKIKDLEGRYKILKEERKFIIDKTKDSDHGVYSCVIDNERKDIIVYAKVEVRTPSNAAVVEGEKLNITCLVAGTDPQITWKCANSNLTLNSSYGRFLLFDNEVSQVKNAIFVIENASLDDRGEYRCIARNEISEVSDVTMVRVKGKMAALWPFLGICAEVFVLCAIILIYEKRRNKAELDESDTDQNNDQKKKRRNYD